MYYKSIFKKNSEERLVNALLFGSENFTLDTNANIVRCTIEFLKATDRFNGLLFKSKLKLFFFFIVIT